MKKLNGALLVKVALLLAFFAQMGEGLLGPAMNEIASSFPGSTLFNLFLTGPAITCVIGTLLCGFLVRFVSKKTMLVWSYILYTAVTSGGALVDNMTYMVTMRLLSGLAYGASGTVIMGLIAELYADESERSFMMGATNSAGAAYGVILALVGGYLAAQDWHYAFYPYLFGVPILILIIIFIPHTPPEGGKASGGQSDEKDKLPLKKLLPIVLAFGVYGALFFISLYYVSFYLAETDLGDASIAGIIASVGTASGFLAGLVFTFVYTRLRKATPAICFLLSALFFIVLAFPSNIWVVGAMNFIGNFAFITLSSYYFMHSSMIVPPGVMTLTMAILTAAMSIGGFFSAYIFDAYQAIFRLETVASVYLCVGITIAIGAVISIILAVKSRNEVVEENPEETQV
jgi:MFS family permease